MPTVRHGKVRRLLRDGLALVVLRCPFTIRLKYREGGDVQDITLGVDSGSTHVGLSATTEDRELFSSEVELRQDVVKANSTRRESRRTRRYRKTRYRKARFSNRRRKDGWIAPSVDHKVESHIRLIEKACSILPISRIVIEVAQFDTQLLQNPEISGEEYQRGEQLGFWNTREYVLYRDGHVCQHCKGKSGDKVLNVHHLESRKTGGDSPSNLLTLCRTCHDLYHRGEIRLKAGRKGASLRDAAVMNIMRMKVYERAKSRWGNVHMTYGYRTKHTRISCNLPKGHAVDARCISGHPKAVPCDEYIQRQVSRHTRSLHVFKMGRHGKRRSAVAPHFIGSSRLQRYDLVLWEKKEAFIAGSTNGRPVLRDIDWKLATPSPSVTAGSVKFLCRRHGGFLIQRIKK